MAGSISDFKSSFNNSMARSSRFDVNIPIPLSLIPYLSSAKNLTYRCEAAQLPGRTFATMEQKTYGPIEKYPYLTSFTDIDLTILMDDDMNQKVLFDAWLNYINPQYNNNFRYKGDYATILTVNQYDNTNKLSYSVNLYDAYPISINQMDLNWSSVDTPHKLSVVFANLQAGLTKLNVLVIHQIDQAQESVQIIDAKVFGESLVDSCFGKNILLWTDCRDSITFTEANILIDACIVLQDFDSIGTNFH